MDRQKAEAMLAEATAELRTAQSVVSSLQQVVSGLQGLLKAQPLGQPVINTTEPEGVTVVEAKLVDPDELRQYPSTADAVLTILRGRPNYPMGFPAIWQEIQSRGLVDPRLKAPRNSYSNAAQRLAQDDDSPVVRIDGKFQYRTEPSSSDLNGQSVVTPQMASRERPFVLAGTGPAWQEETSS